MKTIKIVIYLLAILTSAVLNISVQAQSTDKPVVPQPISPEVQYLRAIHEELRLLRAVMQQTAIGSIRARILAEHLARQQGRVEMVSEEINRLKAMIAQVQDTARGEDDLLELETQIRETPDPQERARLIQAYNSFKRSLERDRAALDREAVEQTAKLQQLEISLQMEQARLTELQSQLERLDRELERLGATAVNRQ